MSLRIQNIALICCTAFVFGCLRPRYGAFNPEVAPGPAPEYAVLYYPYGPSLNREITQPVPDYTGWPEERMIRDMQRLRRVGVDLVLVAVDYQKVDGTYRKQQYERFTELVDKHPKWPRIAYWITASKGEFPPEIRQDLTTWIITQINKNSGAHFQLDNRPLVVLAPNIRSWPYPHPALTVRRTSPYRRQWVWSPPTASSVKLAPNREQSVVFCAWRKPDKSAPGKPWILPRNDGQTLQRGLRKAVPLWTSIICIDSWNNYQNGSFTEPNELDGWQVYRVLQEEINFLKKLVKGATDPT